MLTVASQDSLSSGFPFLSFVDSSLISTFLFYEKRRKVQIEYRVAVSLGSFIRQAIALRESWISEVCARGRLCKPPDHWSRNLFQDPPSDAEFPAEIAEKFDDGQPWYNAADELSCFAFWRALDEDM